MGLTSGLILLAIGLGLFVFAIPRGAQEIRPFLRGGLVEVAYPALCLVLIAFGAAFIITSLLGAR
jgi:hypothetical protein